MTINYTPNGGVLSNANPIYIHIGINGYVSGQQFDTMMGLVGQRQLMIEIGPQHCFRRVHINLLFPPAMPDAASRCRRWRVLMYWTPATA